MCWVSPDRASDVFLVCNSIDQWVLCVWGILSDSLVVSVLGKITNFERTKAWWFHLVLGLLREVSISSISFPVRIEATMLENRGGVRLRFVEDQSSSSLVIQFSHVFLSLVSILSVMALLLKEF